MTEAPERKPRPRTRLLVAAVWTAALPRPSFVGPSIPRDAPSFAAGAERAGALAPERSRGLVMGVHGSALTLGSAAGVPLAGMVVDHSSPAVAIAVVAGIAVLAAADRRCWAGRPTACEGFVEIPWRSPAVPPHPVRAPVRSRQ